MTVIMVVDVVGASPNAQTSGGLPVRSTASASFTNSPFGLPVIRINLISGSIHVPIVLTRLFHVSFPSWKQQVVCRFFEVGQDLHVGLRWGVEIQKAFRWN